MQKKDDIALKRAKTTKHPVRPNSHTRASRYNYKDMEESTLFEVKSFASKLAMHRLEKGISAREMSLSLGQGAGYINNIENGRNMPSMAMFFEICEYLNVTPVEFFEYSAGNQIEDSKLLNSFHQLSDSDKKFIFDVIERLKR